MFTLFLGIAIGTVGTLLAQYVLKRMPAAPLPPKHGYYISARGGKQYYRKWPTKKDVQPEANEGADQGSPS